MRSFLTRFAGLVSGVLSGFDRLFFRGTLRGLAHPRGLQWYLWANRIPYKDFAQHSQQVTAELVEASLRQAQQQGREIRYLNSSEIRKEDVAREIAQRDRIREVLVCVLRSVDPCMSFQINKNHATRKLEIHYRQRKCLHLYHYQIHPVFGFMHTRIQTWFPFRIYVCINGREWLARQMDQERLHYVRRGNTFTWLEDVARTQALFDRQLQANWPSLLGELAKSVNPIHADIFAQAPCKYYWSVADSEWATDAMFTSRRALEKVYPQLVQYAVTTFTAVDVLRFLGQPVPASGKVPHARRCEVSSNLKERVEGCRVKHWVNQNSIKIYDKLSVLRTECMVRQPGDFKVYRPKEGDPEGPKAWRQMRCGIADLHRRAEVSQSANDRYLQALAAVHDTTPLAELAEPLCRPALEPVRTRGPARQAADAASTADQSQPQQTQPINNSVCTIEEPARGEATRSNDVGDAEETAPVADNALTPCQPPDSTAPTSMPVEPCAEAGGCATSQPCAAEEPCAAATPGEAAQAAVPEQSCAASHTVESTESAAPEQSCSSGQPDEAARPRRVRALNPLSAADATLLEAVSQHEFLINGLRNRTLRRLLFGGETTLATEKRRRTAVVTRKLRLLRGHGLIHKVPKTHRYIVSDTGRRAITALLAARNSSTAELIRCAG